MDSAKVAAPAPAKVAPPPAKAVVAPPAVRAAPAVAPPASKPKTLAEVRAALAAKRAGVKRQSNPAVEPPVVQPVETKPEPIATSVSTEAPDDEKMSSVADSLEFEEKGKRSTPIWFDTVYWNFPHAGCVKGFHDGHPFVHWRHVNLMRKFFKSVRQVMKIGGMVKVSTNEASTGVDAADMVKSAELLGFKLDKKVPFNDWELSDYDR